MALSVKSLKLYIVLTVLSLLTLADALVKDKYKRHRNKTITGYAIFEKETRISCALKCFDDDLCTVFSIKDTVTGFSKCVHGQSGWRDDISVADGWSIYTKQNICDSQPCRRGQCKKYLVENSFLDIFCCVLNMDGTIMLNNSKINRGDHYLEYTSERIDFVECDFRCRAHSKCMVANSIKISDSMYLCQLFNTKDLQLVTDETSKVIQKIAICYNEKDPLPNHLLP